MDVRQFFCGSLFCLTFFGVFSFFRFFSRPVSSMRRGVETGIGVWRRGGGGGGVCVFSTQAYHKQRLLLV